MKFSHVVFISLVLLSSILLGPMAYAGETTPSTVASSDGEEEGGNRKISATTASDYQAGAISIGEPGPSQEIENPAVELKGTLGYYNDNQGAHGLGAKLKVKKTFYIGSDGRTMSVRTKDGHVEVPRDDGSEKKYGFQIDLSLDASGYADLRSKRKLFVVADVEVLGIAPFGLKYIAPSHKLSVWFTVLRSSLLYQRDVYIPYSFFGHKLTPIHVGLHGALPAGFDISFETAFGEIKSGVSKFGDESLDLPILSWGGLSLAVGKYIGFSRAKLHASIEHGFTKSYKEYYDTEADGTERESETVTTEAMVLSSLGFSLERLGGSPIGLSYELGIRYAFDRAAVENQMWLYQHMVGVSVAYF